MRNQLFVPTWLKVEKMVFALKGLLTIQCHCTFSLKAAVNTAMSRLQYLRSMAQ